MLTDKEKQAALTATNFGGGLTWGRGDSL